jgi:beta-glucosidase
MNKKENSERSNRMNYKNSSLPIEERVKDLLSRMNLDEKLAQLTSAKMGDIISDLQTMSFSEEKALENISHGCGYLARIGGATDLLPREIAVLMNRIQRFFIEKTRLGIPVLFMTEATSGVLSRNHTLFPQNIGAGAMFDAELVHEMGNAVREEMMATGERFALAPVVDVIRDHRYGRYEESYGEDVYLVSQCGMAYTKGLQSESLKDGIAATLKHYVAQGISDGGRNCAPIHMTEREMLDQYAVPFEAAIREAGAACVMAAYHELDGVPCHISKKLLKDTLRDKLGFEGLLVSDGNGVQLVKTFHDYCEKLEDTVSLTLEAGIECELDYMYKNYLKELHLGGKVDQDTIDRAAARVLTLKFNLGVFDKPYVDEKQVDQVVCSGEHRDVSRKMARQSMTLLKNHNDILPLPKAIRSIAVVGPLADKKEFAYSDYSYPSHIEDMYYSSEGLTEEEVIARTLFFKKKETRYEDLFHDTRTVYQARKQKVSSGTQVYYSQGLKDTYDYHGDPDFYSLEVAAAVAAKADVVIAVCGDTSGMGRENDSGESIDRVEINLSHEQRRLLQELKKTGKPVILVLCNGRPLELSYESREMDAILEAWRPGMEGAAAIADVLFGDYNPAGRLPVTLPKYLGQLPVYYSQHSTGKRQFWRERYLETDLNPLYPFGYGLSYTTFEYKSVSMTQLNDRITVSVTLGNTGSRDGEEVVQIYVRKRFTSVKQPERELKAYKRVAVAKGEQVTVSFDLLFDSLCYHNIDNQLCLENCTLDVMLGASSEDIRAEQTFSLVFENGMRKVHRRVFTNPAKEDRGTPARSSV